MKTSVGVYVMYMSICLVMIPAHAVLPDYFLSVLKSTVKFRGGGTVTDLGTTAVFTMEQMLKRVTGIDPSLSFNMSDVRSKADPELMRLLLLAVIGNFTTGAEHSWQQPCSIVADPATGRLAVDNSSSSNTDVALRVLVVILCVIHFKRWVEDEASQVPEKPDSKRV